MVFSGPVWRAALSTQVRGSLESSGSCEALNGAGQEGVGRAGDVSRLGIDKTLCDYLWLSSVRDVLCLGFDDVTVCGVLFTAKIGGPESCAAVPPRFPRKLGPSWARCRLFRVREIVKGIVLTDSRQERDVDREAGRQAPPQECGVENGDLVGACRLVLIAVFGWQALRASFSQLRPTVGAIGYFWVTSTSVSCIEFLVVVRAFRAGVLEQ